MYLRLNRSAVAAAAAAATSVRQVLPATHIQYILSLSQDWNTVYAVGAVSNSAAPVPDRGSIIVIGFRTKHFSQHRFLSS